MYRTVSLLAALLLASVASAPVLAQNIEQAEIRPSIDEQSLYGTFLAGREAMGVGDSSSAAPYLIRAADARPEDPLLRERAFAAALLSGDIASAARLAPTDPSTNASLQSVGHLAQAVEAIATGKGSDALAALAPDKVGYPHQVAAILLTPWAQASAGDWEAAVAEHDAKGDVLAAIIDRYNRAQILEMRKRYDEAETVYKGLLTDGSGGAALFYQPYGEFLERRGRRADALAVYDQGLQQLPRDAELMAAKARVEKKGKPPAGPDIRKGAAQALYYAGAAKSAQRQTELTLVYNRMALRLDPTLNASWLSVGDMLAQVHNEEAAREAWSHVTPNSHLWSEAQVRIAYSEHRSGDLAGAITRVQAVLKTRPDDAGALVVMADLLRADKRWGEAIVVLDQLVAGDGAQDWRVLYMRAATLDKLGRWPEAEADVKKALELNPDQPELLNYLGYAWIDRGIDVTGGLALVEKAVAAQPRSGAMQDSLGWAQYRLGAYDKAVEVLEKAVNMEPADASINDHLGDAYWMLGRKDEARFQWRRVLTLQPDAEQKAAAEAKLKDGLPPASVAARQ